MSLQRTKQCPIAGAEQIMMFGGSDQGISRKNCTFEIKEYFQNPKRILYCMTTLQCEKVEIEPFYAEKLTAQTILTTVKDFTNIFCNPQSHAGAIIVFYDQNK